jgi:hypothetical protein
MAVMCPSEMSEVTGLTTVSTLLLAVIGPGSYDWQRLAAGAAAPGSCDYGSSLRDTFGRAVEMGMGER